MLYQHNIHFTILIQMIHHFSLLFTSLLCVKTCKPHLFCLICCEVLLSFSFLSLCLFLFLHLPPASSLTVFLFFSVHLPSLWRRRCCLWRWCTHAGTCPQSSGGAPSSSACSVLRLPCWTRPAVTLWVRPPVTSPPAFIADGGRKQEGGGSCLDYAFFPVTSGT